MLIIVLFQQSIIHLQICVVFAQAGFYEADNFVPDFKLIFGIYHF